MQLQFIQQKNKSNYYIIQRNQISIGEITYRIQNNIFILSHLWIYPEHQDSHYGYEVIEYILNQYKPICIIGETIPKAEQFWNKCITKYNGQKREITYYSNCLFTFVIPKQEISNNEIYNLLAGK